jgi:prepilin-type N-terminal cleavage/methylation domain-containing protein
MKSEKGFSLLEVIIAIALLGIVGVAFLGSLATASRAIFHADERATAESLARTEMEYIRNQEYSGAPWDYTLDYTGASSERDSTDQPSWWSDEAGNEKPPFLSDNYQGYIVEVTVKPLHATDDGIQEITVVVKHLDKPEDIVTLVGYRSLR